MTIWFGADESPVVGIRVRGIGHAKLDCQIRLGRLVRWGVVPIQAGYLATACPHIENAGLKLESVTERISHVSKGMVIGQDPEPYGKASPGFPVTLIIAFLFAIIYHKCFGTR